MERRPRKRKSDGSFSSFVSSSTLSKHIFKNDWESFYREIKNDPKTDRSLKIIALYWGFSCSYKILPELESTYPKANPTDLFRPEVDDKVRSCKVYLCFKKLVKVKTEATHHWALLFEYSKPNERKITYEALEENGYLIPRWNYGSPIGGKDWFRDPTFLRKINVSPADVLMKAKENIFNGQKYILTMINCQIWVKELAKSLGIELFPHSDKVTHVSPKLGKWLNLGYDIYLHLRDSDKNSVEGSSSREDSASGNTSGNIPLSIGMIDDDKKYKNYVKSIPRNICNTVIEKPSNIKLLLSNPKSFAERRVL